MEEKKKKYKTNYNENSKENLITKDLSKRDDFKELSAKGGREAAKKKKEFRHAKDLLIDILSKDLSREECKSILGKEIENRNTYNVMLTKIAQVASTGNVKAAEFIRDTAGDKPTESVELTANVITDKDRQLLALLSDKMTEKG